MCSKMVVQVSLVKLSSGYEMPMLGLGTYARKADPGQFRQAVEWAIDAGYRHIDTASCYKNEEEIGEGIANKIKQGVVNRQDLFVTTKGKGEDTGIDHVETWRGMEEAVKLGLTRSIGVSNFNEEQLERLYKSANIKPVVNQFEINPTLTQHKLVNFCKDHSIVPVAYTPLGLISEARPEFIGKDVIKTDPKLGELAQKYGKTRAQIALRYLIQRGIPALPKSFTKTRIEENLNIFDFELTNTEMDIVDSYNIDHRCVPGTVFANCKNYPF
ncbi:hypothetical protein ABMA28_008675 [Loxostege sticticalis]|uniref:NADP-dependent oxidoreductase domain-containing protein n=1 Tax=Loxostege sticticalis TaxID=481309 RepID=A0ABD0SE83_LOXSC